MKKLLCLILCGLVWFGWGMRGKKKGDYEGVFGKKYGWYGVSWSWLKGGSLYVVRGDGGGDGGWIGK